VHRPPAGQFLRRKQAKGDARKQRRVSQPDGAVADFYWETDAEHRITRTTHAEKTPPGERAGTRQDAAGSALDPIPTPAGWAAHRALLDARNAVREFELGASDLDGDQRFLSLSGGAGIGPAGEFLATVRRGATSRAAPRSTAGLRSARRGAPSCRADRHRAALRAVMRDICRTENWTAAATSASTRRRTAFVATRPGTPAWGPARRVRRAVSRHCARSGEGLVGHVWQSGEPLWCSDVSQDRAPRRFRAGARSRRARRAHLPGDVENRVVGVLSISSARVRAPTSGC